MRELPELTIPADPVLASGEYDRTREAQKDLAAGQRALESQRRPDRAGPGCEKAETLNPGFYQNSFMEAGRALLKLGRRDEAKIALQKALDEQPAFFKEKKEIEDLLHDATVAN